MSLTPKTFLIVCPMLFLAGFVDAIGGGGGLISLPAYLFAGLPIHAAIATNKLSSMVGTAASTARFAKNRLINWKLSIPSVLFAVLGSSLGARISLSMDEQIMRYILFAVLSVSSFVKKKQNSTLTLPRKRLLSGNKRVIFQNDLQTESRLQ